MPVSRWGLLYLSVLLSGELSPDLLFFPGLAPFYLSVFEDNCTADEDIIVRVTNVEHFPMADGSDSISVYGVLVDEAGNESIQDTVTILLVDDIAPEVTCVTEATVFLDDMGNAIVTDTAALVQTIK